MITKNTCFAETSATKQSETQRKNTKEDLSKECRSNSAYFWKSVHSKMKKNTGISPLLMKYGQDSI